MADVNEIMLHPGGSPAEVKMIWDTVVQNAQENPGQVITLRLLPGEHHLQAEGSVLFANGIDLIVNGSGQVVRVAVQPDSGKLIVDFTGLLPSMTPLWNLDPEKANEADKTYWEKKNSDVYAENRFRGDEFFKGMEYDSGRRPDVVGEGHTMDAETAKFLKFGPENKLSEERFSYGHDWPPVATEGSRIYPPQESWGWHEGGSVV